MRDVQFLGAFTDEMEQLRRRIAEEYGELRLRIADLERQVSALAVENARLRGSNVTDRHTSWGRARPADAGSGE